MDNFNIDFSDAIQKARQSAEEIDYRITESILLEHEYQQSLDDCVFETRDLLRQMQEASEKESIINQKRHRTQTAISVIGLLFSLVAAVAAIIAII